MTTLAVRERNPARPPKPDIRLNVMGALAATSFALLVSLAALLGNLSPPTTFAGVLQAIPPACGIPAAVLLAVRARSEQDEALRASPRGWSSPAGRCCCIS